MTGHPTSTDLPFPQALRELLAARTTLPSGSDVGSEPSTERATLNALAARAGVAQSHLWHVVNRPAERRATIELIAKVAHAFALPDEYFLETRARRVDEYLRAHPGRLNAVYAEMLDSGKPLHETIT